MTQTASQNELSTTRQRLLEAAGQIFAEQGFRAATVRDICQRAGANIAAVNYHFGDKEGLYRAALTDSARHAFEKYPIGGGVAPDAPAPARLRAFIRGYLDRLLDEGRPAWHGVMIAREMVEPTAALEDLAREFVEPQAKRLRAIISEIVGKPPDDERVRRCAGSVVGQCIFYKHCKPMIQRIMPEEGYDPNRRDALAEHIYNFSIGGLSAAGSGGSGGSGGEKGARP